MSFLGTNVKDALNFKKNDAANGVPMPYAKRKRLVEF